jgi:hypothetical protein
MVLEWDGKRSSVGRRKKKMRLVTPAENLRNYLQEMCPDINHPQSKWTFMIFRKILELSKTKWKGSAY